MQPSPAKENRRKLLAEEARHAFLRVTSIVSYCFLDLAGKAVLMVKALRKPKR